MFAFATLVEIGKTMHGGTCRVTRYAGGVAAGALPLDHDYRMAYLSVARSVLRDLEDRRILFGHRSSEDADLCRQSADLIRRLTSTALHAVQEGPLVLSLKRIRAANREFVAAAGKNSSDFLNDFKYFMSNLEALRLAVADEIGWLAFAFAVEIDEELASVIPDRGLVLTPS